MLEKTYKLTLADFIFSKVSDYLQLIKFRLSLLVVFSSTMGFLLASIGSIQWGKLGWLILGGVLITGASNAMNQLLEKEQDKLMKRTRNRPLPANRMSSLEALLAAGIMCATGILILWAFVNTNCAMLASLAFITYAFIYTPMKRLSSIAVLIGAFPGALAYMLGWVAVTNYISPMALLIFSIQFIWQFPHTWAIAWMLDDDYKKVGFKMLPSKSGRSKNTALQTMLYTFLLIPISLLPGIYGITGPISSVFIFICGLLFLTQSVNLYRACSLKAASKLMFASIIYLPVVQLALVLDKI